MSRSGYTEDVENNWDLIRYRGAVTQAIRGKRGQAFLREMLATLDAMPEKALVANELEMDGQVCAMGSVGAARGIDMSKIDPEDPETVAKTFGIAESMAREIAYVNDEGGPWRGDETPEARFEWVRKWIAGKLCDELP